MRFAISNCLIILSLSFLGNLLAGDISNAEFSHLSTQNGLSQKTIQSIYQDRFGFIWLGTQEGLNRYDGKNITVYRHSNSNTNSLSHDFIQDIFQDSNGNLWIATKNGLNRFDYAKQNFERVILFDTQGNEVTQIFKIFQDRDGKLWLGTSSGLFSTSTSGNIINFSIFALVESLVDAKVRTLYEDSLGSLWVGTEDIGLIVLDKSRKALADYFVHNKTIKKIRAITEDYQGKIWIGTRGGGLVAYDKLSKSLSFYKANRKDPYSLSNNRVYDILEDSNKRLWIATDSGVNILDRSEDGFYPIQYSVIKKNGISHSRILKLFEDSGGLVWLGTQSGADIWNRTTANFVHYQRSSEPNTLRHNYIHGFAQRDGDLFIATFGGGIDIFSEKNGVFKTFETTSQLKTNLDPYVTSLLTDNNGRLWIGTLTQGVYLYDFEKKTIDRFSQQNKNGKSISANGVTDILQDRNGVIWVSTFRGGLNKIKLGDNFVKTFRKTDTQGLTNENILQITEDDFGYIWMTSNGGGIFRLDSNTELITNYKNRKESDASLSGNNTTAIFNDSNGNLWIGTQGNGLNRWSSADRQNNVENFSRFTLENGMNSSTVNSIVEDNKGFIWISTNKGVSRLDPRNDNIQHYELTDGIHNNELNFAAALKSNDGRLYFGGLNGISAFYPNQITTNRHVPSVVLTSINSQGKPINTNQSISQLTNITFEHSDNLIEFEFAALDFAQPSKNQYQYKLEGFDNQWFNIGTRNRAIFTNLPSGAYTLKVKGSNNDGLWSEESINLKIIILPAPWLSWWALSIYAAIFSLSLIVFIRSQAKRIAEQDLYRRKVSESVQKKVDAFQHDNQDLQNRLTDLERHSGRDVETGLANQNAFSEQVQFSFGWLKKYTGIDQENSQTILNPPRLFCIIFHLHNEQSANKLSDELVFLEKAVREKSNDIHLTARWNTNELSILGTCNSAEDIKKWVAELTQENNKLIRQKVGTFQLDAGYCLMPQYKLEINEHSWEYLLVLAEKCLKSAMQVPGAHYVGLNASYQPLTTELISQVVTKETILDMLMHFDISTSLMMNDS